MPLAVEDADPVDRADREEARERWAAEVRVFLPLTMLVKQKKNPTINHEVQVASDNQPNRILKSSEGCRLKKVKTPVAIRSYKLFGKETCDC